MNHLNMLRPQTENMMSDLSLADIELSTNPVSLKVRSMSPGWSRLFTKHIGTTGTKKSMSYIQAIASHSDILFAGVIVYQSFSFLQQDLFQLSSVVDSGGQGGQCPPWLRVQESW